MVGDEIMDSTICVCNNILGKIRGFLKEVVPKQIIKIVTKGNWDLFLFIITIGLFKPQVIAGMAHYYPSYFIKGINVSWKVLQVFSFVIIFLFFIFYGEINKFNLAYMVSIFSLSLSSLINKASLYRFASSVLLSTSIILLFEVLIKKRKIFKFMKFTYYYHTTLIILNFLSILIFPNSFYTDYRGMNVSWIFGNYQQNFNWYVIYIMLYGVILTCYSEEKLARIKKLNTIVVLAMIITTLKVWSAVTIVSLFVSYVSLYLMKKKEDVIYYINGISSMLFSIFLTLLFAVFKIQHYFSFIIEKVLRKKLNFSGRSEIWDRTLSHIYQKPILGFGTEDTLIKSIKIGKSTAHNHYLDTIYNGGIIYLIIIFIIVYLSVREIIKNKETIISKYVSAALNGYFVYFIAEAKLNIQVLLIMLATGYYITEITKEINLKNAE